MNRRRMDIIGDNMKDPFFDSYQQEADTCCDIISLIGNTPTEFVNVVISKKFLQSLVHSHLNHIRDLERELNPRVYSNASNGKF